VVEGGRDDFTPYITRSWRKPDFVIVATAARRWSISRSGAVDGIQQEVPLPAHAIELSTLSLRQNAPEGVYGTANYLFYTRDEGEQAFVEESGRRTTGTEERRLYAT